MTTKNLIRVEKITIEWTEAGPFHDMTLTGDDYVTVWDAATQFHQMILTHYRATGGRGYCKTMTRVVWEDGREMRHRVDLGEGGTDTALSVSEEFADYAVSYVRGFFWDRYTPEEQAERVADYLSRDFGPHGWNLEDRLTSAAQRD